MSFSRLRLVILWGWSLTLSAQTPLEIISKFQQDHAVPGLFVGIHHGSKSWMYSLGKQGASDPTQVTNTTLFELGSVSKTFTTLALAEIMEQGEWTWATTVADLDARFAHTPVGRLTLLDLVTHRTGGMPLQVPDTIKNEADFITYLQNWQPELPGARSYANPSIGLAAWLVGQHTEKSFQKWMDSSNFKRWGFDQTHIQIPDKRKSDYATGMGSDGKERRVQPDYLWEEAYGVKSSGRDMLLFVKRLLNPALVAKNKTYQKALQAQRTTYFAHPLFEQGLMWEALPWPVALPRWESTVMAENSLALTPMVAQVNATSDGRLYQKTGSTGGFSTYVVWIPQESWGFVLLANRSVPNVERVRLAHALWEATKKQTK